MKRTGVTLLRWDEGLGHSYICSVSAPGLWRPGSRKQPLKPPVLRSHGEAQRSDIAELGLRARFPGPSIVGVLTLLCLSAGKSFSERHKHDECQKKQKNRQKWQLEK